MAALTEDMKRCIVMELAMFATPSEAAATVKELYGVEVTRQQAFQYDPHGSYGPKLAEKWKLLHAATRAAFLKDTSAIPIANKAYRLRRLDQMARTTKNPTLAAQLLEQAAKETGGAFTNRREHTGKNGGPIQFAELSDEQLDAQLAALLGADDERDPPE